MKQCVNCKKALSNMAFECPYCGGRKFQDEEISIVSDFTSSSKKEKKNIYSDKIESLIDMALSDGELTEKEKQVLFKKAESEGIDLDEFEMVLDAKLNKIISLNKEKISLKDSFAQDRKTELDPNRYSDLEKLIDIALTDGVLSESERSIIINKSISLGIPKDETNMILDAKVSEKEKSITLSSAPKSDKFGDIRKCPACASIVSSFSAKCSDCGHEFSNVGANVNIAKLFEMLNTVESERKDEGFFGAFGAKFDIGSAARIIEKKKSIITGFPIPNTKDDILEFLSIAIPNAKLKGNWLTSQQPQNKSHNDLVPTWKSKCEQIIMKARFSLKEDPSILVEINNYAKEIGIK